MAAPLTVDQVREFLQDYEEQNLLLDKAEFTDTFVELCMQLAVSEFNSIQPIAITASLNGFPSMGILLYGTCWMMFQGRAALAARNNLTYSDGGLQIPVEEKFELYTQLAATFREMFQDGAQKYKISANMESGWGCVFSDERNFPLW
jgi:hypothetical protein